LQVVRDQALVDPRPQLRHWARHYEKRAPSWG
jgi:hypothetical protein